MAWFSLWLPLLLQLVLPLALLVGLAYLTGSRAAFATGAALVAVYILAIATAGLWLVLPWYAPAAYGTAWLGLTAWSWRRVRSVRIWPVTHVERGITTIAAVGSIALLGLVAVAWSARRAPADVVDVTMPVREGTYLVVNGGGHVLVNAHLNTLSGERFAPYRGQSYGVDLVRVNALGLRARGLLPDDPTAYVIFGDPVRAPCAGRVVVAHDGLPDLPPPTVDRAHLAGNHVILACERAWVVLGHLRNGSLQVRVGDDVHEGQHLGHVGNSGNTGEPHLHIHAQRPGTDAAPLGGEPLPIGLDGRVLARNDRIVTAAGTRESPFWKERLMASARQARRIVLIVAAALAGSLVVIVAAGLILSPGTPIPFRGADGTVLAGSISEKTWVDINGVRQGMFIKGRDATGPVLLFVHGGTGMPEHFLTRRYPTGLDGDFTVVWWDRRGAGLSYSRTLAWDTVTIDQAVQDTLAVTDYLRARFHQDKVYLMAHSGGTLIALQAAARSPERFHAYIGVGQMTWQLRSENLSYAYLLQRFRDEGNTRMVRALETDPPTMQVPLPRSYMTLRDRAMHTLGVGTTRDMQSVISGVFLASWLHPEYTLAEKMHIWRGKFACDRLLWNSTIAMDLTQVVRELALPVYLLHGAHDYTVSFPLAKEYFDELKAPLKGFYTFPESAHSPFLEEPAKTRRILQRDVLAGGTSLADVPGDPLGRVGNSGNTGEPHLHIHAQRPGTDAAPLAGEPLPIGLDGRSVARGDRNVAAAEREASHE